MLEAHTTGGVELVTQHTQIARRKDKKSEFTVTVKERH